MKTINVYGSSDDLIEIEGAIREEFCDYGVADGKKVLAFSDGTVLSVHYDGEWTFKVKRQGSKVAIKVDAAPGEDAPDKRGERYGAPNYSDLLTLTFHIAATENLWVVYGQMAGPGTEGQA